MAKKKSKKAKTPKDEVGKTAAHAGRSRLESTMLASPVAAMRRLSDEVERRFDRLGFGDLRLPRLRDALELPDAWGPDVDMFEKNGQLVIRADLPGLKKEDITVELTDTDLTIEGERSSESEEERDGYYRSERTHGSFRRTIALPDGARTDRAKATCKDGVLEVTMPTGASRKKSGRRLQIKK